MIVSLLKFLKNWMLPLAMLTGVLTYPWMSRLLFLTPYLIFTMLLLTFSRLSPRDIHLRPAHLWLLFIQLAGCLIAYAILLPFHPVVAQGALICMLVPTATSAVVITGMLGGNIAFLTTYQLLCNVAVAIAAPIIFSLLGAHTEMPFLDSLLYICRQVAPLLLLPLLLAWLVRYTSPKIHKALLACGGISFYLWSFALVLVTAATVRFLVQQENPDYTVEISMAIVSLILCVGQFMLGWRIGKRSGDLVSAGQGLGQKNTILAIWMAQAYLNPLSSIAPAAYILWQNVINSYQLWRRNHHPKQ